MLDLQQPALERAVELAKMYDGEAVAGQLLICYQAEFWMLWCGIIIPHMPAEVAASIRSEYTGRSHWLDHFKCLAARGHAFQEVEKTAISCVSGQ